MRKSFLSIFLCCCLPAVQLEAHDIYLSPGGDDTNEGTRARPLATLYAAQKLARQIYIQKPSEDVVIYLGDGVYMGGSNYTFDNQDGGSEKSSLTICALPGEDPVIMGSRMIPVDAWQPLSRNASDRLHPAVNAKCLVELDLRQLGINSIEPFPDSFVNSWNTIDLFVDDERMPISMFPNAEQQLTSRSEKGWMTCNGSKDERSFYYGEGGRPKDGDTTNELESDGSQRAMRWAKSMAQGHDLWLKGNFRVPWDPVTLKVERIDTNEKWIRLIKQPAGGMGSKYSATVPDATVPHRYGSGDETYYALNYLDEIDEPGEWAIDFKDKKLYFYPKGDLDKSIVRISDNKAPLILMKNAKNVTFEGITFTGSLGYGIEVNQSENIKIVGCKLYNLSSTGIYINKSKRVNIQSNDIHDIGSFGVFVNQAGDLAKLDNAGILINNNHIYRMGQLAFNGGVGLFECVGVTISHNLIHDTPKNCIENRNSIQVLMEYNEMHNIALRSGDTGAVYSYGGWYTYGNVLRYNFLHHLARGNGLYADDGDSGDVMYGNIIHGAVNGFHVGGGHDNLMFNNLLVDCERINIDNRGIQRNYRLETNYEKNLLRFKPSQEPWLSWGKKLVEDFSYKTTLWAEVLQPEYGGEHPRNCVFKNNVLVKVKKKNVAEVGVSVEMVQNLELPTVAEANFFNYAEMDLRTNRQDILNQFPDLNEVFPKIGLYIDKYRKQIVSRKSSGGLNNRLEKEGDKEDQLIFN